MQPTDQEIRESMEQVIISSARRFGKATAAATYTATTESTGYPQQAFNLASLRRAAALIDAHEAENGRRTIADMAAGLFNPFGSIRFRESPLATSPAPVRKHNHRRNQTEAYHRRVQKKWTKRFGTEIRPCVFQLDAGKFGLGSMMVVHPDIARAIRSAAIKEGPADSRGAPW